jgi:hypothetical protein
VIDWRVLITGIVCLTTIEVVALCNGINGTLLTAVVGIIALVIGITIPTPLIMGGLKK